MKTIAQQLNVKEFPFRLYDAKGNEVYCENSDKNWHQEEYDVNGNKIYFANSTGYWAKWEYNKNNKVIHCEDSRGVWYKREFDRFGTKIYYENSRGVVQDNRPKPVREVTMQEVETKFGCVVKIKK